MNPPLILTLLLLAACPAFSQKIEKYYDFRWKETELKYARYYSVTEREDSGWHRKDYFLREKSLRMEGWYEDSAGKIKNGWFLYAYPNRIKESAGRYVHGKKQGVWLRNHPNGTPADSTVYNDGHPIGTSLGWHSNGYIADSCVYQPDGSGLEIYWFDNGNPSNAGLLSAGSKPHGRWKYYHKNGRLSATELYDHGKLLEKQYFDENGTPLSDTSKNDRSAVFPGGQNAWLKYLQKKLFFPTQYQLVNSDRAIVVINAMIDEEGNVQDAYVSAPFHPDFDKIALHVVQKSPRWLPARNHNRNVKFYISQPVAFAQPE